MNIRTSFLAKHPVFTRSELDSALAGDYSGGKVLHYVALFLGAKQCQIMQS